MSLENLRSQINIARKSMKELAKKHLIDEAFVIFNKYPELKSFGWEQYTSYWNDGEPTSFSVYAYSDCIDINGEGEYTENFKQAAQEIEELLNSIEDCLLDIFGDHTKVTIYHDGSIKQEEYSDHD